MLEPSSRQFARAREPCPPVASPTSRASPIAASPCARAAPTSRRTGSTDRSTVCNDFINKVNAHVKSRGGTLRLWNDGIADISRIPIDKDVIIEYWAKGESSQKDANRGLPAKDLVDAGYTLVSASSALYYYRDQPSSYVMQVQGLDGVYGKWTMNSFYQNEGYAVPDASIRGGKVSIWQGGLGKMTDHETEAWIADGLRYGAQMFWNGKTPKADPDTQAFKARIDALGEPSTYTDPTRDTLTSQASSALDVSIAREGDEAYPKNALSGMDRASPPIIGDDNWGESVLNVSVTNKGTAEVTGIHLTPSVSNSWVLANGPQPIDRLAPGETRVVKFWARPTTEFGEATFTVDVSYAGEKTVASEGLVGVCGPRIKAEAVAADSVETRWEYGEEYKATDGDPST